MVDQSESRPPLHKHQVLVKVYFYSGLLLNVVGLASIAQDLVVWKGFFLAVIESYKAVLRDPIHALLQFVWPDFFPPLPKAVADYFVVLSGMVVSLNAAHYDATGEFLVTKVFFETAGRPSKPSKPMREYQEVDRQGRVRYVVLDDARWRRALSGYEDQLKKFRSWKPNPGKAVVALAWTAIVMATIPIQALWGLMLTYDWELNDLYIAFLGYFLRILLVLFFVLFLNYQFSL